MAEDSQEEEESRFSGFYVDSDRFIVLICTDKDHICGDGADIHITYDYGLAVITEKHFCLNLG